MPIGVNGVKRHLAPHFCHTPREMKRLLASSPSPSALALPPTYVEMHSPKKTSMGPLIALQHGPEGLFAPHLKVTGSSKPALTAARCRSSACLPRPVTELVGT